ncbi:MAG: AAC(3) family N-acetyltransferase [Clostridia bacterium]|nr:AAC(3) family N-acetyltransferase [Clostridia bacterium]
MDIYISECGIRPSEELVQTKAIQDAIDKCEATGGGTVYFEPGTYRTGTLYLRNNTHLFVPPACRIKGSDNLDDYNEPYAWPQNMPKWPEHQAGQHLIVGLEIENTGIRSGGIIDGNGKHFGYSTEEGFLRPGQMVYFCESKNIHIRDVELLNSGHWTCFIHGCEDVIITGVHIKNNPEINNSDGIDLDCSRRVVISDCIIDSQDDCITFRGENGLRGFPLKDSTKCLEEITVSNCQLRTAGCNAFRIGVGNKPIRNCRISNIIIKDSSKGICIESRYTFNHGDKIGTPIENISFSNLYIDAKIPIFLSSFCNGVTQDPAPPIKNISFSNMDILAHNHIVVQANDGAVVDNISFTNVNMTMQDVTKDVGLFGFREWDRTTSTGAFYVVNATNVKFNNVNVFVEEDDSVVEKAVVVQNADVKTSEITIRKPSGPLTVREDKQVEAITSDDIVCMLENLGIKKDDKVIINTSLKSLGVVANGPNALILAIYQYLSEGMLIIPTYTWETTMKTGFFDVKETMPCLGVVSDAIILWHDQGVRSLHPTHSVYVLGEGRHKFIEGEENCTSVAPRDSWMSKLYSEGGKILCIGADMKLNAYLHWVEEALEVPNRISDETVTIDIKDRFGNIIKGKPFHPYKTDVSENFNNYLKPLMYTGAVQKTELGQGTVYCCDAKKTYETIKALWEKADYDLTASDKEIPESYYVK